MVGWHGTEALYEYGLTQIAALYREAGSPLGATDRDGLLRWALRQAPPEQWGDLMTMARTYLERTTLPVEMVGALAPRIAPMPSMERAISTARGAHRRQGEPYGPGQTGLLAFMGAAFPAGPVRQSVLHGYATYLELRKPRMVPVSEAQLSKERTV